MQYPEEQVSCERQTIPHSPQLEGSLDTSEHPCSQQPPAPPSLSGHDAPATEPRQPFEPQTPAEQTPPSQALPQEPQLLESANKSAQPAAQQVPTEPPER